MLSSHSEVKALLSPPPAVSMGCLCGMLTEEAWTLSPQDAQQRRHGLLFMHMPVPHSEPAPAVSMGCPSRRLSRGGMDCTLYACCLPALSQQHCVHAASLNQHPATCCQHGVLLQEAQQRRHGQLRQAASQRWQSDRPAERGRCPAAAL